jgi:predicted secreted hydrolase
MKRRAEFYTAPESAFAWRPMENKPDHMQFWYIDAALEDGTTLQTTWILQNDLNLISAEVQRSDGTRIASSLSLEPGEAEATSGVCDVRMRKNRLHGAFPKYLLQYQNEGFGLELGFESQTPIFMEPPDGIFLGREQVPPTPYYWGYVIMPRCEVRGTLTLNGQPMPARGKGYLEHSWLNQPNYEVATFASWSKVYAGEFTLMFWNQVLGEAMGFQDRRLLFAWKGGELVEYKKHADMFFGASDFEEDAESGLAYPKRLEIRIDEERVQGVVSFTARDIAMKTPVGPTNRAGDKKRYYRFLADCRTQLTIEGEDVDAWGPEIYEMSL